MTEPIPVLTEDGSFTLYHSDVGEHYHSTFGAIQESRHVFINSGLDYLDKRINQLKILEVGMGTGLNALLTLEWSQENEIQTEYISIEPYPISTALAEKLNYHFALNIAKKLFLDLHNKSGDCLRITPYFSISKLYLPLHECKLKPDYYDVVFFDAFSPDAQPELWTEDIFIKLADSLKRGGLLTTYSSKGIVKRALKSAGFDVKKLAGPPGKREIIRAIKGIST
jgi:tRNA U34 5-methylaminomethyl-2-thiouridine-forming methyltransferase MnmC